MGKIVGAVFVLGGIAGGLFQWTLDQKAKEQRVEAFIRFFRKAIFSMETEKMKLVDLFAQYISKDWYLNEAFYEIAKRLASNMYPKGELVWESVLEEYRGKLALDREVYEVIIQAGTGFFGRNLEENKSFLEKSIQELERRQIEMNIKNTKERKVWIPVFMLSGVMVILIFL